MPRGLLGSRFSRLNIGVQFKAGPNMQNMIRRNGKFASIPGLQGNIQRAHQNMAGITLGTAAKALRQRRYRPTRHGYGGLGRILGEISERSRLVTVYPPGYRIAGFKVDFEQLDMYPAVKPYWRAVNYGYGPRPVEALFFSGPLWPSTSGHFSGPNPARRGRDPRMPHVNNGAEFTIQFGGHHFIETAISFAVSESRALLFQDYVQGFPPEWVAALRVLGRGGSINPRTGQMIRPGGGGFTSIIDPAY